jgi:hypothetical protein
VCLTLVLRWVENLADNLQPPNLVSREIFTEENFGSYDAAFCFARKIRREGYRVGVRQSEGNVMPDSITPEPVI